MSVYIVAQITITDRERYAQYEQGFMQIFEQYSGELLAVDEQVQVIEGTWPHTRTVLIKFPEQAAALAWYESDEYQSLVQHRFAGSHADIAILSGLTSSNETVQ